MTVATVRRPPLVLALSTLYAILTAFALYQHIAVCPFPTEDTPDVMGVTQRIGRWICSRLLCGKKEVLASIYLQLLCPLAFFRGGGAK